MANKYGSILRTLRGRRLHESTISPPSDFTIASNAWNPVILNKHFPLINQNPPGTSVLSSPFNLNSNFTMRRIGLFCNFADGLVSQAPPVGVDFTVRAVSATRAQVAGMAVTGDPSSRTLTYTGGIGTLAPYSIVLLQGGSNTFQNPMWEYGIIESIGGGNMVLFDYPKWTYSSDDIYELTPIAESNFFFGIDLAELNYMYECDQFFTPVNFSTAAATDIYLFGQATCNGTNTWLTKSISADFDGDKIVFDMLADIEYTIANDIQSGTLP